MQEIGEQRKSEKGDLSLEDLSSHERDRERENEMRRECEGISLLLMTAEYQLLFAVDITVRRARSKKKRKTIHETRETS